MEIGGHVALVTGGGSGLGAATAERLAAEGARVAVIDRNPEAAAAVAGRIGGLAVACDVADAGEAEAGVRQAREALGPARILVNCAGIGVAKRVLGRDGPMPLTDFDKVIRVNLVGSFNMLRLAAADMSSLPELPGGARGIILSTASVAAYEGQVGQAAYSASKAGIVGMTLPVARELAQFGIRVLAIAPGLFHTPMMASLPQDIQDSLGASVPFPRRLGQPAEYAETVVSLIRNPYLNGEVIRLDGALRLPPR